LLCNTLLCSPPKKKVPFIVRAALSIHTCILYSHRTNIRLMTLTLAENRVSTDLGSVDTTVAAISHSG
jgi:hypothetical protein